MNWLSKTLSEILPGEPAQDVKQHQPAKTEDLQDILIHLSKWGKPRVGQYGNDGHWHCSVEVNITPIGAKFEVRSDYSQATPLDAAIKCRENLLAAIKSIGATT